MRQVASSQSIGRVHSLAIDATLGLALCVVPLVRALFGGDVTRFGWEAVAVTVAAGSALVFRREFPVPALALATSSGVLAMRVDLHETPVDALLGLGLLAVTAVRAWHGWRAGRLGPRPRAWLPRRWLRRMSIYAAVGVAVVVALPVDLKETAGAAVLLCAYTVATANDRRIVLAIAPAAAGALVAGATLVVADAWTGPNTPVPLVAAGLVGAAVGDAVRSRRELMAMWEERARRAEQALEGEARRRVAEERLRIAREVHDLVAHHIAVVSMHTGLAAHHLPDRPQAAVESLRHARETSRTVLGELGTLVGVLRGADDPVAQVEPTPGLADLPRLLDSLAVAGLQVDRKEVGTPYSLPPATDLSAYRVVQESLTNARKHGTGHAWLTMTYAPEWLEIEVCNALVDTDLRDIGAPGPVGTGHGLLGMRERVLPMGGSLEIGPSADGEFVVRARLPARCGAALEDR